MNERLVFFCDRDQAPGHLYSMVRTDEVESVLYQVYSRQGLDENQIPPDADLATLRKTTTAAGGGMVAETRQRGDLIVLRVLVVPGSGFAAATELMLLRPGQPPQSRPIDERGLLELNPGELVLLPVTAADQANLAGFLEHCGRLPADYRGLVLEVLRHPGIEGALLRVSQRLEALAQQPSPAPPVVRIDDQAIRAVQERVAGLDQRLASAAERPPATRIRGLWPWALATLLLLNLGALGGMAWYGRVEMQRQAEQAQVSLIGPLFAHASDGGMTTGWLASPLSSRLLIAPPLAIPAPGTNSPELAECQQQLREFQAKPSGPVEPKPDEPPKTVEMAIVGFLTAWKAAAKDREATDPVRKLADTHLDGVDPATWLKKDKTPYFRRQEIVAYAVAKYLLADAGVLDKESNLLIEPGRRTNTKKAMQQSIESADASKRLPDGDRAFLAWIACQVFPEKVRGEQAKYVRVTKTDDPDESITGDSDDATMVVDLAISCNEFKKQEFTKQVIATIEKHTQALNPSP